MGPGDRPDALTPAERQQYEQKYVPGKLRGGDIPRTPMQWREASTYWHTRWLQGKTFERGVEVVFGLKGSGWQREVERKPAPGGGKSIWVDFHLPRSSEKSSRAENIETKSGAIDKQRDVDQLREYERLLRAGEVVRLVSRAERDKEISKEARAQLALMKAKFPTRFEHKSMNERVYTRIMEAGARALERDRLREVAENLGRLPEREARGLTLEEIAREYAKEAPTAGIEQLRLMSRELRELAQVQSVAERDLAEEGRKGLGLRFQAAKDVEREQHSQLSQEDRDRHTAIDAVTFTLTGRERDLIERGTEQAAQQLQQQLDTGRINVAEAREQFQGLAYALGKNQELERRTERDAAARGPDPADAIAENLHNKEATRQEKDRDVSRQIGTIGAVVEHETGRRQKAELSRLAIEVNRERLLAQGVDPEQARLQAPVMPAPTLRDSDRGKDPKQLFTELGSRTRAEADARKKALDSRVAALVEQGVPPDAAKAAVQARLSSPHKDHRSMRDQEVERVEAGLMKRGVPPEIARAAAEGRAEEPPHVKRAKAAQERARMLERGRGIERDR